MVFHPITKTQKNKIKLKQNKIIHAKKVKFQLMVGSEKYIVFQMKQCFLVQPTKLSLSDLGSKF